MLEQSPRLPFADEAAINEILNTRGKMMDSVDIATLESGNFIRVLTTSGNRYLLEVIDPAERRVHMYRHEARGRAPEGYRGERTMVDTLKVSGNLRFLRPGGSHRGRTHQIVTLVLL